MPVSASAFHDCLLDFKGDSVVYCHLNLLVRILLSRNLVSEFRVSWRIQVLHSTVSQWKALHASHLGVLNTRKTCCFSLFYGDPQRSSVSIKNHNPIVSYYNTPKQGC